MKDDGKPEISMSEYLARLAESPVEQLPVDLRGRTARHAFQTAFEMVGGVPRLALWATGNYEKFITLYARLIAVPSSQGDRQPITINLPYLTERNINPAPDVIDGAATPFRRKVDGND